MINGSKRRAILSIMIAHRRLVLETSAHETNGIAHVALPNELRDRALVLFRRVSNMDLLQLQLRPVASEFLGQDLGRVVLLDALDVRVLQRNEKKVLGLVQPYRAAQHRSPLRGLV